MAAPSPMSWDELLQCLHNHHDDDDDDVRGDGQSQTSMNMTVEDLTRQYVSFPSSSSSSSKDGLGSFQSPIGGRNFQMCSLAIPPNVDDTSKRQLEPILFPCPFPPFTLTDFQRPFAILPPDTDTPSEDTLPTFDFIQFRANQTSNDVRGAKLYDRESYSRLRSYLQTTFHPHHSQLQQESLPCELDQFASTLRRKEWTELLTSADVFCEDTFLLKLICSIDSTPLAQCVLFDFIPCQLDVSIKTLSQSLTLLIHLATQRLCRSEDTRALFLSEMCALLNDGSDETSDLHCTYCQTLALNYGV